MAGDDHRRTVLPSGLTVVTLAMPYRHSVAVGAWCRSGARDEPAERLGISHFIEHMMFKGTETRDARTIARMLEALGGHLDAFTAREQVCYHARALSEHLPAVVEIIADIVCRSRFALPELEREKSVVREEIFSCEDNPEEKVNDLHAAQVWGEHGLGLPILGTVETVNGFDPDAVRAYYRHRYRPDQLVIAAAGGLDHAEVVALVERAFAPPEGAPLPLSPPPPGFRPTVRHEVSDDLQQLYLSLGTRAVSYTDERRYAVVVLHTLLGANMSSRLFQSIREEAGLAYSVGSAVEIHRDAGQLSIHLGVSPDRGREALHRLRAEMEDLVANGPQADEVEEARSHLRGELLMSLESVSNRMFLLANEEIYAGRHLPPEERLARLQNVTHEQVAAAAREFLDPSRFALTALGPADGAPLGEHDWRVAG